MSAIIITEAAEAYLADLLAKQNTTGISIRVFITQPGTPNAETCIAYCKPGEEKPEDTALSLASFTAYIVAVSEPFLEDAVVDYTTDPELIDDHIGHQVDLVIDGGIGGLEGSTVIDLTQGAPVVLREGKGPIDELF